MTRVSNLTVGLLVAATLVTGQGSGAASDVTLTVQSSKAVYAVAEAPAFAMTLSLASSAPGPVTICPIPVGTVRALRVTRDGARVRPTRAVRLFYEHPEVFQLAALATLSPGQNASIAYHVPTGSDGVTPQLEDVRVATRVTRSHKVLRYPLVRPGLYEVQFAYNYQGPDGGHPDVLRGRVVSNVVTFTLQ